MNNSRKKFVKTHYDLEIFQLSFDAAMRIFELSKKFPREGRYSLTIKYVEPLAPFLPISQKPGEREDTRRRSSANSATLKLKLLRHKHGFFLQKNVNTSLSKNSKRLITYMTSSYQRL